MGAAQPQTLLSIDDYLAWDANQTERTELIGGVIHAMAGAEDNHVTVALNIAVALRGHLKGSACRTYMSDMKLRVEASNSVFYPDVMVSCSAADATNPQFKSEPTVLVEVLSRSTANIDRGEKLDAYREIPALREYMLVDIPRRTVHVYRRVDADQWAVHTYRAGRAIELASLDFEMEAQTVFADLLPQSSNESPT